MRGLPSEVRLHQKRSRRDDERVSSQPDDLVKVQDRGLRRLRERGGRIDGPKLPTRWGASCVRGWSRTHRRGQLRLRADGGGFQTGGAKRDPARRTRHVHSPVAGRAFLFCRCSRLLKRQKGSLPVLVIGLLCKRLERPFTGWMELLLRSRLGQNLFIFG